MVVAEARFGMLWRWLALAVVAYLLGAFPTGVLVARARGVDLTQHGSRRTGATNALRVLGKRAAIAILLGDALKGLLAVRLADRYGGRPRGPPAARRRAPALPIVRGRRRRLPRVFSSRQRRPAAGRHRAAPRRARGSATRIAC